MSPALLSTILGGVGLFLLGMILMTEGLRSAAGDALRSSLERWTRRRFQSVLAGAGITALVQSSSVTTIATIGFVSAGLLTFPNALGVVLGANLGTTSTGWIVSLLGLKLRIGAAALPLVGIGALLRLLGSGRRSHLGTALAGFGLIFVGIDTLQAGMAGLSDAVDLSALPARTLPGRVALVAVGAAMTVVMQSSSAAVATTLTALHAGTIGLEQAALLVVGQNVGTTVKAALASVGASVPARRTALAHIVFNLATGAVALAVLPQLLGLMGALGAWVHVDEPAVVIAGFHTGFNLLGVLLFLPFTGPFARAIERAIPDRGPVLTRHLDRSLAQVPSVAVEAVRRALVEIGTVASGVAIRILRGRPADRRLQEDLARARAALAETRFFLGEMETSPEAPLEYGRHVSLLHAMDHLDRLVEACGEASLPVGHADVRRQALTMASVLERAREGLTVDGGPGAALAAEIESAATAAADVRRRHRVRVLEETAAGRAEPDRAQVWLDAMRWIDRVGYHVWRATLHLVRAGDDAREEPGATVPEAYLEAEP